MIDREALHKLVDSLPEEALASVERALQFVQTWPPVFPEVQKLKDRMNEVIAGRPAESAYYVGRKLMPSGSSMELGVVDREGNGRAHATGMVRGKEFNIELHRFQGQEIQIDRQARLSPDKRKLHYRVTVKGPDGSEVHHQVDFEATEAPPPGLYPRSERGKD
jgi:hypothetical protein